MKNIFPIAIVMGAMIVLVFFQTEIKLKSTKVNIYKGAWSMFISVTVK